MAISKVFQLIKFKLTVSDKIIFTMAINKFDFNLQNSKYQFQINQYFFTMTITNLFQFIKFLFQIK